MIRFVTLIDLLFLSPVVFAGDLASSSSHVVTGCNSGQIAASCGTTASAETSPPYDASAMRWTFDPRELVSAHDVVYAFPLHNDVSVRGEEDGEDDRGVEHDGGGVIHVDKPSAILSLA
jgi:hypothetical protein